MPSREAKRYIDETREHGLGSHFLYYPGLGIEWVRQQVLCMLEPMEYFDGGVYRRKSNLPHNSHLALRSKS